MDIFMRIVNGNFFRLTSLLGALAASYPVFSALPPVPVPAENPYNFASPTTEQEAKRVLGKILFWEEQLSTDNTVACGTCHLPSAAGADPRVGIHPGPDGVMSSIDDVIGSPGVIRRDSDGLPIVDAIFGGGVQVTDRLAPNFYGGIFSASQFWDGRAEGPFIDPLDGVTVAITTGGALEIQALGPILSEVEMAKEGRTWQEVTDKLASVTPLAFAATIPADMSAVLSGGIGYSDLFLAAFGDSAITPVRIAFAIATYERTLTPDQSPFDLGTMNAQELAGNNFLFVGGPGAPPACLVCHGGLNQLTNSFSDNSFRNIGVAFVPAIDVGREGVTSIPADLGRFKVPTLRNIGVKDSFMHNGQLNTLAQVIAFYAPGGQNSAVNIDPLMPVGIPPTETANVIAFLQTGLTDPRVASGSFPFDAPILTAAGELSFPLEVASEENVPIPLSAFYVLGLLMTIIVSASQKRKLLSNKN